MKMFILRVTSLSFLGPGGGVWTLVHSRGPLLSGLQGGDWGRGV